jgi:transposase
MTYRLDWRKGALTLLEEGKTKAEVARWLAISRVSLYRWLSKGLLAKTQRATQPRLLKPEVLEAHVKAYPDAYQRERAVALGVSRRVVWYGLKRLGIKKNASVPREELRTSQ